MYGVENNRQRFVTAFLVFGIVMFSPRVLLSEQMSPPILFDMGTEKSPVERGYVRITAKDLYNARKGYGFLEESSRSFVLQAMGKELGCSVEASYEPLNACALYTPHTKPRRYKLSKEHWQEIDPAGFELPVCHRIFTEESVCFHHTVLMGTKADVDLIVKAIEKIYDNAEELL